MKTNQLETGLVNIKTAVLTACFIVCSGSSILRAELAGPIAEWDFDEGQGQTTRDATGNGHDAKLSGASWVKQGNGFAVSLDGMDDYIDCGANSPLKIVGPLTFEVWVKPMGKGWNGGDLISASGCVLSYSKRGECWWNVGGGGHDVGAKLELRKWNHVVGAFDGQQRSLWINGHLAGYQPTVRSAETTGKFILGSICPPHFKGLIDKARVYDRAVSDAEVVCHYKSEAANYGFDPTWFQRVKVTPYYYFDRGQIVVEIDCKGLQPLAGIGSAELTLVDQKDETKSIEHKVNEQLPEGGVIEVTFPCEKLPAGNYAIHVSLHDDNGSRPVERITFSYPPSPIKIPSPNDKAAGNLPGTPQNVPFKLEMDRGGGFHLLVKDASYPFQSRISWPHGDYNYLSSTVKAGQPGEKSWKVDVQPAGKNCYRVEASGAFYTVHREIEVFSTHVYVKDTYTNTSDADLGLLIYNEMPLEGKQLWNCRLAGYEGAERITEDFAPYYGAPNVFISDKNIGLGIVPMDDVYVLQAVLYANDKVVGTGTEKFALAPGKAYTLEWAIYPNDSGDYYDFVNTFRKSEGRIGTVEGAPGFIAFGPMNRRQVPSKDFVDKRGLRVGIIQCLSCTADDPEVSVEGIEFMDFPKEIELLKKQIAAIKKKNPEIKVVFHVAHSLYCTNQPDRFADSKVIRPDGKQVAMGGAGVYFSKKRDQEGWRWYVYYPTPGNSFHEALMKSVDVMMDQIGADGAFVDGFFLGHGGRWTYDGRWDGHSAEIDPQTKTIKNKIGSVLLLMQPSMIEYARKIRNKGGVVISNSSVITRSIAQEKYIIFDAERESGPECHFAPSSMALANPPLETEREVYLDMLDKLSWGELFVYFCERINLTYPSLAARQFPMTFEEIRSGMVRGRQRIVTMNSGVYGWPDDRNLHVVYKFDDRGAPTAHNFVTTVDKISVRTELVFAEHESAVIEPIPLSLNTDTPVNLLVTRYDHDALTMLLNGHGEATLEMFVGTTYPDKRDGIFTDGGKNPAAVGVGDAYRVTGGGTTKIIEERDGTLSVPLKLSGQFELAIERTEKVK